MEEQQFPKQALDKFRQWHFWWLVVFSFLLIVIFVYYLPTRFLQQVDQPHGLMPIDESKPQGHEREGMMTDKEMREHMKAEEMGGEMEDKMDEMMGHEGEEADHGGAAYHEEGDVKDGLIVNLNISPVPYNTGIPLSLDFFVNQKPGNVPVLASQLQLEHEKLMHVIGVRSDMNEFFHIHPEFLADNPSIFSIDHIFNKPGSYKIWSEVKKDGVNYSFGHPEVNVNGSGLKEEKPFDKTQGKQVSFSRNIIIGNYQVSVETGDTVVMAREVDISFDIHSLTGMEIEVEQYLGADMHLSIIKDDWKQFMHVHPEGHSHSQAPDLINVALAHSGTEDEPAGATDEHQTSSSGDEVISFHVTFPEAGLYKAFAQFRPKGIDLPPDEALTAEFWIQVEEKAALPISQWWMLLIISAVLIAGLSWWVNNYLKVKPEDIKIKK